MIPAALLAVALLPQDPVPSTVAFRQACLDATTDALVMNVAAHPDDESARTMVYLRNKLGLRTVTVYSTCGEGGQNAIGREIGRALAAIRVRETRAAAARYGTVVRWLGFPDFGYSKSLEETLSVWGREPTLEAMRRALDEVAPDVVLTNHSLDGGHGHHRASYFAIHAACAARSAAVGHTVALYRRAAPPSEEETDPTPRFPFDVHELDPVRGLTFARQAHEAWTLHASQGPWGPYDPTRTRPDLWMQTFPDGEAVPPLDRLRSMFDLPEIVERVPDVDAWRSALLAFGDDRPVREHVAAARRLLPELRAVLGDLPNEAAEARTRLARRIDALERVVFHGSGLALEIWTPPEEATVGGTVEVRVALRGTGAELVDLRCGAAAAQPSEEDGGWFVARPAVPTTALEDPLTALTRTVVFPLEARLVVGGLELPVHREVVVALAPDRDLAWDRAHAYVPAGVAWTRVFSLEVLHDGREPLDAPLRFRAPEVVTPSAIPPRVALAPEQRQARVLVRLAASGAARSGPIDVVASLGTTRARLHLEPVALPDGEPPRIALVRGPDDTTQRTLEDLGLPVTVLDETALATAELGAFDTLILDIRAYSHRPDLASHRERILAFCRAGGRVVAFYHKEREWNERPGKPLLAPFELEVGRERVSEEDAPIVLLERDHPLWRRPFAIGVEDFEGWVQERALNLPSKWDPAWVPLLETHDRGEEPHQGALLAARYGRGEFVYCSLALYRQLRIAHPGAVRILLNLVWM